MNTNEIVAATGAVRVLVTGADGAVKHEQNIKNLVVTTGLSYIASRMKDTIDAAMTHMAVGAGTTAAALGQTALVTESARVALASTTVTANAIEYVATFPAGTPATLTALTEAGVFNASSSGTMLCRTVFAAVNKDVGDTMSITWTITIS